MAEQKGNFDIAEHPHFAADRGRGFFDPIMDILRAMLNGNKRTPQGGYPYGLFEPALFTDEDRAEFLGGACFTKAIIATCDRQGWAIRDVRPRPAAQDAIQGWDVGGFLAQPKKTIKANSKAHI